MRSKINIILILLSFTSVALGQMVTGKVIDKDSGEPIPFAKVSIKDLHKNTLTDTEGKFSFNDLPEVTVQISVYSIDYGPLLKRINTSGEVNLILTLEKEHTVFEEVIVSAAEGKLQRENITAVEYRSKDNLFASGSTTLGEALVNIPGVQQNTIGVGISRPVIRGLSGMRVITYWDGLRIENQQWGEDHGMAATELGLQGVEVVKGPASLLYGADALGGVIQFQDQGYVNEGEQRLQASSRFESNSMGTTNEIGYQLNNGKIRLNVFGNYLSHTDFQLPNATFVENSRFWSSNLKTSFNYRKNNYLLTIKHHGHYSRLGIPGHTHDTEPVLEEFISNRRGFRNTLAPAQYIWNNFLLIENKLLFKRSDLLIQTGNTINSLREFEHNFNVPFTNLLLTNNTYNVRYSHHLSEKLHLKVGTQGMYQFNRNLDNTLSYLIPNANATDNGAYALLDYELGKWRFQAGARYDMRKIQSFTSLVDSSVVSNIDVEPINRTYQTANYSAGFSHNTKHTTVRANLSTGFRAPHLAELLANGVHHGSLRYERGDRNLTEEHATQIDFALELHFDHLEITINPYFSAINNFIYLQNTDSVVNSLTGNYNYFEFRQVNRAFLYGGEIGFHYHPHQLHRLHLESNFSITIGEDEQGNALNLMPQPLLNSRVRLDINNPHKLIVKDILLEHQFFMDQYRVAPFERPTDGFHLVNLAANFEYRGISGLRFSLGVRNLLNTNYIAHLSPLKNLGEGIPQPGINFFGKLSYNLTKVRKP